MEPTFVKSALQKYNGQPPSVSLSAHSADKRERQTLAYKATSRCVPQTKAVQWVRPIRREILIELPKYNIRGNGSDVR